MLEQSNIHIKIIKILSTFLFLTGSLYLACSVIYSISGLAAGDSTEETRLLFIIALIALIISFFAIFAISYIKKNNLKGLKLLTVLTLTGPNILIVISLSNPQVFNQIVIPASIFLFIFVLSTIYLWMVLPEITG